MALTTKAKNVKNVTAQRAEVQAVIVSANHADAALAAAEYALDNLDRSLSTYAGK